MTLIDAHAHLWDTKTLDYPWIEAEASLPRSFLPDDLRAGDRETTSSVFVQAECLPSQGLDEARWVAGLGASDLSGIVAFAPLDTDGARAALDALAEEDLVVGVRRLLQGEGAEIFADETFHEGLVALSERGWSFDACVRWTQLGALGGLAQRHESLAIVLDHLGKPPIDDPDPAAFARWRDDLAALAALPRVSVKLSGLPAETTQEPTADLLGPWLRAVVDLFGPSRCMLGSDYPVSIRGGAPRSEWFELVRNAVQLSSGEWDEVREGTARRVYRLV